VDLRRGATPEPPPTTAFVGDTHPTPADADHPDYALFKAYTQKQSSGRLVVSRRDEHLYAQHVRQPSSFDVVAAAAAGEGAGGRMREGDALRYEAYRGWVEGGTYDLGGLGRPGALSLGGGGVAGAGGGEEATLGPFRSRVHKHVKRNSAFV
jgi:hypothetical protein